MYPFEGLNEYLKKKGTGFIYSVILLILIIKNTLAPLWDRPQNNTKPFLN